MKISTPTTWVVGKTSFIAQSFLRVVGDEVPIRVVDSRAVSGLVPAPDDVVVNFGLTDRYRREPYAVSEDLDLKVAHIARKAGARMIMLSTRMVYGASSQWAATETAVATGLNQYGVNKLETEQRLMDLMQGRAIVLRLSNVIGFEWPAAGRRSFMTMALGRLHERGEVRFDMAPAHQRDFVPVDHVAESIARAARQGGAGLYNIGAGFPIACHKIADSLIEGHGQGSLVIEDNGKVDEFYLDTGKAQAQWGLNLAEDELLDYCRALGAQLRHA